jgi:pimeloyl-ACP methyl ester carboxylesterase
MADIRRWVKRIAIAVAALFIFTAGAGICYQLLATRRDLAAHPPPGRLVDVGGHRLHIWCTGEGTPAVILDSGLGGSFVDWGKVQPAVAKFTQVCSYDRAGMGYSDEGPSPRTARQIATELATLLDRVNIRGPVVLAGASIGGLNSRLFASERSDRTAGLVLVDASHENQRADIPSMAPFVPLLSTMGIFRLADISFGQPPASLAPHVRNSARVTALRTSSYQTAASELLNIEETRRQIKTTRRKLDIPVIVVTAGRNTDPEWRDMQRDQVTLSHKGCQIIAVGSGHVIPVSQPETVIKAIHSVVESARGHNDAPLCGTPI